MFSAEELRNPGFSWFNTLSLAMASKYSYENLDVFKSIVSNGWDVQISAHADISDTQAYVLENDHMLLVVYRGTESIGDWLTNFRVFDTDGALGQVHKGFFKSFKRTEDIIVPAVNAANASGKAIWFTGHSLGGAIAMVAAMELADSIELAGLVTFGQPRTARRAASDAIDAAIGADYFRFVNDDDVVTRLPLSYGHTGQLFHFDGYGQLQEVDTEAEGLAGQSTELPELTEDELENLRAQIEEVKHQINSATEMESTLEGGFDDMFDASVEGLIPSIFDHSMDRYLSAIRRYAIPSHTTVMAEAESIRVVFSSGASQSSSERVAAGVVVTGAEMDYESFASPDDYSDSGADSNYEMAVPYGEAFVVPASAGSAVDQQEPIIYPLLLEVSNRNWKPPSGVKICSQYQRIVTVLANDAQMQELALDPDISLIENSREAGILELDTSIPFSNGDAVQAPGVDERGDQAIVGIIDTGIDILHNAFVDQSSNQTRLIAIWDQSDETGPTPHSVDAGTFTQDYGTLHTQSDINDFLAKHRDGTETIPSKLRDKRHHGSHVASIAAGQKTNELSPGMAPEAKLLLVVPFLSQEAGSPRSIGYSNSHVDALALMISAAAGSNALIVEKMPIAINVSLGMNAGAHDGSTLLEAAFDSATNLGRDPGVVIVKSAGNERNHAGHARTRAPAGGIVDIAWESDDERRREDYFEAWFGELDDLAFRVIDPQGNNTNEVSFDHANTSTVMGGNVCSLSLIRGYRDNGANRLIMRIAAQAKPIQPGTWKLEVNGREIGAIDQGTVDIWVERSNSRSVHFKVQDERMTLSVPGTAATVVTVGACNTGTPWRLNASSSYGPTRTGQLKPDVCAPGHNIIAAYSSQNDPNATIALSGTSMAAPHVTGALALALSHMAKKPGGRLPNARQLGAALRRSVKGGTGAHHPGSGYGVLDAKALFDAM